MIKKDLLSYKEHNRHYTDPTSKEHDAYEIIKKTESLNSFTNSGFEYSIYLTKMLPKIHIDLGSGTGWLVRKTSPLFEKIFGIELSSAAVDAAKKLNTGSNNIFFINKDIIDGLDEIKPKEAVFLTTGAVLSHIEDHYVEEILRKINDLPENSVLFFSENYNKNIHWRLWHIRSKDWWREKLPDWQLLFLDIETGDYLSGIYGQRVGKKRVLPYKKMTNLEKMVWKISYFGHITKRVVQKILKYLNIK